MSLKKHLFSTQQGVTLGVFGGDWSEVAALDISAGAQDDLALDTDTTVIMIRPDTDIYILIDDAAATAITDANAMILNGGGGEVYSIKLPKGIQEGDPSVGLHLHVKAVSAIALQYVRVIES